MTGLPQRTRSLMGGLGLLGCLGALLLALHAHAAPVPSARLLVHDDAALFQPGVVERAKAKILEVDRLYQVGVFVETLAEMPPEERERINQARRPAQAFREWVLKRAVAAGVNGIYIFITVDPKHPDTAVIVYPEGLRQYFTSRDAEGVRRAFASRTFLEKPNQVLLEQLDVISGTLHSQRESPASLSWRTIATVLAGALALWLALAVLRMRHTRGRQVRTAAAAGLNPPQSRFLPGLLGGMFGSVAGLWIYDSLFDGAGAGAAGRHTGDLLGERIDLSHDGADAGDAGPWGEEEAPGAAQDEERPDAY